MDTYVRTSVFRRPHHHGVLSLSVLLLVVCLSGCETSEEQHPPIGNLVEFDPPAPVSPEEAGVPILPDGTPILLVGPAAMLQIDRDRKNPVTAVGRCADWVVSCFDAATRTLDDCVRSVPPCSTDEPWMEPSACCPVACKEDYADRRRAGMEPYPALDDLLFVDGTCMPGLQALAGAGS